MHQICLQVFITAVGIVIALFNLLGNTEVGSVVTLEVSYVMLRGHPWPFKVSRGMKSYEEILLFDGTSE